MQKSSSAKPAGASSNDADPTASFTDCKRRTEAKFRVNHQTPPPLWRGRSSPEEVAMTVFALGMFIPGASPGATLI